MSIEISKEARQQAVASIGGHFKANMEKQIGNVGAGALLGFCLEQDFLPLTRPDAGMRGCLALLDGRPIGFIHSSTRRPTTSARSAATGARASSRRAWSGPLTARRC
jgi:hypothetical protein